MTAATEVTGKTVREAHVEHVFIGQMDSMERSKGMSMSTRTIGRRSDIEEGEEEE